MLDIPIGPGLDALVAVVVMGWHKGEDRPAITGIGGYESPSYWYSAEGIQQEPCITDTFANMYAWSPSTDIRAAWQLLLPFYKAGCAAWIEMDGHTGIRAGCTSNRGRFEHEGETAAHAICLVVLEAKGYKP
jgi:hypothetical protein